MGAHTSRRGRGVKRSAALDAAGGRPFDPWAFANFDDGGRGLTPNEGLRFDDARNWDLIEALLQDDKATVRYLFVTPPLKARLLAQAARKHARPELIARAAAAMMSPQEDVHDDHVHVRIACPESMRDVCIEEAMPRVGGGDDAGLGVG